MRLLLPVILLSCSLPARQPETPDAPPPITVPIPGREAVRLWPNVVLAGERFSGDNAFRIDIRIPTGWVIPGQGLPEHGVEAVQPTGLDDPDDGAILHIELPVHRSGKTDEDRSAASIGQFDPPRYCQLNTPCVWTADTDGRWRAVRVRTDPVSGELLTTQLQLGRPHVDVDIEGAVTDTWRMIGLWMRKGARPLDEHDRVVLLYTGHVPRRSTSWWTESDLSLRPRIRARLRHGSCAASDPGCWTAFEREEVQGLRINSRPPAFVRAIAPLDATVGEPYSVAVVVLDMHQNPTPVTGTVRLAANGQDAGEITLRNAWRGTTTITLNQPGPVAVRPRPDFDAMPIHHWSLLHPPGEDDIRRLAGDTHVHTGVDDRFGLLSSSRFGDHRGQFSRTDAAIAYLHQVAGMDFGAISEHAKAHREWQLPSEITEHFGSGEPCEVTGDAYVDTPDWWSASQQIAHTYESTHPGFSAFPAFEWHGDFDAGPVSMRFHRIVLYREHDVGSWAQPMLPGIAHKQPQCLFSFLEQTGQTPEQVLVLPHMMGAFAANRDWDATYRPQPPWDALVDADAAQRWQRTGELYSARNLDGPQEIGADRLSAYEGSIADPATQPWSFRYGWRDTEATLGVIGSSDDHSQMPGSVRLPREGGSGANHRHEPGGVAFVLADSNLPQRDGIFEAISRRATYATSGPRAWLDFHVTDRTGSHGMGSEVVTSDCTVEGSLQLMVGRNIRAAAVWGVQVGSDAPYEAVWVAAPVDTERIEASFALPNPVPAGAKEGGRWLYYLRAYTGPPTRPNEDGDSLRAGHQDAVWSSPIWVDWGPPRCP